MALRDSYNIAIDCVDRQAKSPANKDKTAMIFISGDPQGVKPVTLTFKDFSDQTNRFAASLQRLKVLPGERLLIRLPNCSEFAVSFLGAIKAGTVPVPSSPLLTWHEIEFLLRDSGSSVLVTTQELLPHVLTKKRPSSLKQIIIVGPTVGALNLTPLHSYAKLIDESTSDFTTKETKPNDSAFWLYTSGTEGVPKAVIHAHQSIPAHDSRVRLWQNLRPDDIVLNTSALNWSYALTCGFMDVWRHGVTTVIYGGELSAEKICRVVQENGVTVFMSVPGLYRRVVRALNLTPLQETFKNVRVCLSAGEKLPTDVRRQFKKATGLEIYEGLGMTEHSVYLVQRFGEKIVAGSCGKPLPGSRVAVLKEDLTETDPGVVGILASHMSCPGLMLGYNSPQPPLTLRGGEQCIPSPLVGEGKGEGGGFVGEWFLSGDLAHRDEEGNFFYIGRGDDVVTAGGYRISPLEVEAILNQHPDVSESAVVAEEIEEGKTIVEAFVVLRRGDGPKGLPSGPVAPTEDLANAIIDFTKQNLAKYKVPRKIVFVDELPKTRNGKIKRKELVAQR